MNSRALLAASVVAACLQSPAQAADTTVTVLVAYTSDAATAVGGEPMLKAMVDNGLGLLNGALDNSATGVQVETASQFVEVQGVPTVTDAHTLLGNLQDTGGKFRGVHQARYDAKADIVLMVFSGPKMGVGELGQAPASGMASRAFMVSEVHTFDTSYIFPHEFGHVLGCSHQGEQGGTADYARGYSPIRISGSTMNPWRSVTANGGFSLPYFSANREVSHTYSAAGGGEATATVRIGDATHDCARNIREVGPAYSQLGASLSAPSGSGGYTTRLRTITAATPQVTAGKWYEKDSWGCVEVVSTGISGTEFGVKWKDNDGRGTWDADDDEFGAECTPGTATASTSGSSGTSTSGSSGTSTSGSSTSGPSGSSGSAVAAGEWRMLNDSGCVEVQKVGEWRGYDGMVWWKATDGSGGIISSSEFGGVCTAPAASTAGAAVAMPTSSTGSSSTPATTSPTPTSSTTTTTGTPSGGGTAVGEFGLIRYDDMHLDPGCTADEYTGSKKRNRRKDCRAHCEATEGCNYAVWRPSDKQCHTCTLSRSTSLVSTAAANGVKMFSFCSTCTTGGESSGSTPAASSTPASTSAPATTPTSSAGAPVALSRGSGSSVRMLTVGQHYQHATLGCVEVLQRNSATDPTKYQWQYKTTDHSPQTTAWDFVDKFGSECSP